ncbi:MULTISPECIES: ABC-2 transporter permease [Bacillaceae]|uniref:ABC-2 transporter permease n=1 Tax=Alkalicoccobacillus plakortidis TaxID=444060 RepID=A0A9D5DLB8_9BACI|nr:MULTISPECIES: ABC-2 transporter permease [Bacillaceae]KQL56039.1 hypothetical protein AN965_15825 [Alkalicoccobacillus plakortidis]
MKGLLLNQYYSVQKSIWVYALLAFVIPVVILIFFEGSMLDRLAAFVAIGFMVSPALEVLKHEGKSGWSKYMATLPISRAKVVQSHYLFFVLLLLVGVGFAGAAYFIATHLFNQVPTDYFFVGILSIIGIVLTSGVITYPLTYILGAEKSDMILVLGMGGSIGVYLLTYTIFSMVFNEEGTYFGSDADLFFGLLFIGITLIVFVLSYIVSLILYKRKEF